MRRHCANAEMVANFLSHHEAVAHVSYPGLPTHPNHNLARRYCPDGLGSIFMITLKSAEAAKQMLTRVNLFSHLVNIGETRSLIAHPASTTHRSLERAGARLLRHHRRHLAAVDRDRGQGGSDRGSGAGAGVVGGSRGWLVQCVKFFRPIVAV